MRQITWLLSMALLLVVLTSCEKSETTNDNMDGKGIMNLYLTDAPIDAEDIVGVYITVNDVQYFKGEEGWVSVGDFGEPKVYNLLDLTHDKYEMLGSFTLEAGMYSQLRFMLEAKEVGENFTPTSPGCWVEFADETTAPLFVPSGGRSGFKAVGRIMVPENGDVSITADFDVRRSVIKRPNHDVYILKPVIRLVVNDQAGRIVGGVTNIPEGVDLVVYAYEDGTYTEQEAAEPADETPRFPTAVSSDKVCEEGGFQLWYLAPGTYDLVVVASVEGEFQEVLQVEEDVEVQSGFPTHHNIVLPEPSEE